MIIFMNNEAMWLGKGSYWIVWNIFMAFFSVRIIGDDEIRSEFLHWITWQNLATLTLIFPSLATLTQIWHLRTRKFWQPWFGFPTFNMLTKPGETCKVCLKCFEKILEGLILNFHLLWIFIKTLWKTLWISVASYLTKSY